MATKASVVETVEVEVVVTAPDTPLIDSAEAMFKKLLARGKERGYVTYDELNVALASENVSSEQIEDAMTQLSEIGVNIVEHEEADEPAAEKDAATPAAASEEDGEEKPDAPQRAPGFDEDDIGRTDDPVRMYLREMGSVELLSREGEIAIAKRIEAGREKMIGAICESPLTFRAIIEWHKALTEHQMLLRDIIDLDSTFSAARRRTNPPPRSPPRMARRRKSPRSRSPRATPTPTPRRRRYRSPPWKRRCCPRCWRRSSRSQGTYQKLGKLQTRKLASLQGEDEFSRASERRHDKLHEELVVYVKQVRLNNFRIEQLVSQLYGYNKEIMALEGKLLRIAEKARIKREEFLAQYIGHELDPQWLRRVTPAQGPRLGRSRQEAPRRGEGHPRRDRRASRARSACRSASSAASPARSSAASAKPAARRRRWWRRICAS